MNRRINHLVPPVVGLLVGVAAWYGLAASIAPERRFLLPTPDRILYSMYEYKGEIISAVGYTLLGAAAGFAGAIAFSLCLAVLLGRSPRLRGAFFPFLIALQTTPIIVLAPILVLWVGPGLGSVAIITFLVCFFPLVVNTTQGLVATDRILVDLIRSMRATRWQEFRFLRVPAALPHFFTGLRIAATLAPIGAIAGDFYAGNAAGGQGGLGFLTLIYSAQFKMAPLFAIAVVSCLLGAAFNLAASGAAWLCLHRWHDAYRGEVR